jgi:transcriptional regulator with XRE-family HTH domain
MNVFEKFKFIRDSSKLKQSEFAEKLGVAQSTISKLEKEGTTPDFFTIQNLLINFKVNPNWIFFDLEPIFLDADDNSLSLQNQQLINDINMILSAEEFNVKLQEILIDSTIENIIGDGGEKSVLRKFLEALRLEGHIPFRPLLFLYYIFRYVQDNKDELASVKSYQSYLIDLVNRYNVLTLKNSPAFTSQIKKEFEASLQVNLDEDDCKTLLMNSKIVIDRVEKKMTKAIVLAHKKIDTKTLFPKK